MGRERVGTSDWRCGPSGPVCRQNCEEVQGQIDKITENLLMHEHTLLKDVKSLDILYEKTLRFYDGHCPLHRSGAKPS